MLKVKNHVFTSCILSATRGEYSIQRELYNVNHGGMVAGAVKMIEEFNLNSVDVCDARTGEFLLTVYDEIEDEFEDEFDDSVDESFYNPYMGSDCYD